jgi:hypothetical protein
MVATARLYNMDVPAPVNSVEEEDDLGVEDDMVQGLR